MQDRYWLLQLYEQEEKVGAAGSPSGEDVCAQTGASPPSKKKKTSFNFIARPLLFRLRRSSACQTKLLQSW
jgi:hypothetical protein